MTQARNATVSHLSTCSSSLQVLRSLGTAEEQHTEGGRGGATQKATLLWQGIKRAAYSEADPIARHFLRSIATPVLRVRLAFYSLLIPLALSTVL